MTRSRSQLSVGLVLVYAGAALLVLSAFLSQQTPAEDTLWREGTGWAIVAGAALLAGFTRRAQRNGTWSWAGLWIGALAAVVAVAIARRDAYPVDPGVSALGVAGVAIFAGWLIGFVVERPTIRGLGPWSSVPDLLRRAAPPAAAPAVGRRRIDLRSPVVWSLAVYAVISLAFWAWPVRHGLRSMLIAQNNIDPSVYTWFYGWWPHAVLHGQNPFITHAIFAPDGYNLTWVTAVPGPSLLAAPVTLAFGPVATYNLLAVVAPAVCAWTAFLLCRHVTGAALPSLIGGFVFGFSPYILRMMQGSPVLYFVALIPLFVLLVIKRLEGSLSERALLGAVAVGVALQFLTSNDVLATLSLFGAIALALAFLFYIDLRPLILRTAGVIAGGYLAAAVLMSPVIFFMLFHDHTIPAYNTPFFANDLVSWVAPDSSLLVAKTHRYGGTPPHYGGLAYYSVALLLLVALCFWTYRRDRRVQLAALLFVIPAILGLGHRLQVDGHVTAIGLPWAGVDHLPGLKLLVPQRFPMYAFLAGAVLVAIWLARQRSASRWGLALAAVVLILPWVGGDYWKTPATNPAFFADGTYRRYLHSDDRVLTVPIIGENMRWQSESKFRFELVGGGVGAFPEGYTRYPAFGMLIAGAPRAPALREFVAAKGVTAVVVAKAGLSPERKRVYDSLGARPIDTGGVLFYRLRQPAS